MRASINMCRNMGATMQNVVENIAQAFGISQEVAEQKVNMYW